MWQGVYQTKFHNAKELNQRLLDMRHGLKQSVIGDAFGHQLRVIDDVPLMSIVIRKRPCACIHVTGRHFWHLVCFTPSICSGFLCLVCEN